MCEVLSLPENRIKGREKSKQVRQRVETIERKSLQFYLHKVSLTLHMQLEMLAT